MKSSRRTLAVLLLLALAQPLQASGTADIVGRAYDLRGGELLYSEHYYCDEGGDSCRVEYRDLEEEPFARKELDYSANSQAPALTFSDTRFAREFSLDLSDEPALVVDAGFDNFLRSRWEELERGEAVAFRFRAAGGDRVLGMVARRDTRRECAQDHLCVELVLDSWFLNLLARPIQLTYAQDSRRLLRYSGLSNIRGADGKSQNVDIVYQYRAAAGE